MTAPSPKLFSSAVIGVCVALAGCNKWIDQEPACGFKVYDWSDDLLAHVRAGNGQGSFDYNPEDVPRERLQGQYHPVSGQFWVWADYVGAYYLDAERREGYGTVYHDGDLDLVETRAVTDAGLFTATSTIRVKRDGCDVVTETWPGEEPDDNADVQLGAYVDDDTFTWTGELAALAPEDYDWHGSWHANGSRTETFEYTNGSSYSQVTTKPSGVAEGDVRWNGGAYTYEGTYKRRFDGGEEMFLVVTTEPEWVVAYLVTDYDYDGSGTEVWVLNTSETCELTVDDDGDCSSTCANGLGSC